MQFSEYSLYTTPDWNFAKKQTNAKQHPKATLCHLKIIHILHPRYHPKIIGHILKNSKRTSVCLHEIMINNDNGNEKEKQITQMQHQ